MFTLGSSILFMQNVLNELSGCNLIFIAENIMQSEDKKESAA